MQAPFCEAAVAKSTDMYSSSDMTVKRMPSITEGKEQGWGKPSIERPKLLVHGFVCVSADETGGVGVAVAVGA